MPSVVFIQRASTLPISSMERDGYEADLNRLFIMNLETGEKRFVSIAFESNVDAFLWSNPKILADRLQ